MLYFHVDPTMGHRSGFKVTYTTIKSISEWFTIMWILDWVKNLNLKSHIEQLQAFRNALPSCGSYYGSWIWIPSHIYKKKKCSICGKQLAPSSVSRHMKDKHGGSHKCTICGKKYQTTTALENHQTKAHVVKIISYFECDFCEHKSMNKYYMTDHLKRQHAGDGSNSFVCSKCFTRKQNEHLLKKHMQEHKESNCVVCGKKFNSTKNLKRHGQVHTIKRCQECGKNFNSKKYLRVHQKEHKKKKANMKEQDYIDNIEDAEFIIDINDDTLHNALSP